MDFLERIWEFLSLFFGGLLRSFERGVTGLFGSSNARYLRKLQAKVDAINALEEEYMALSDNDLKGLTQKFRDRLAQGETLDDILVEAFAAVREAGRRFRGMRHYDVQLMGGMVLHSGSIAEMVTGEGKTLVATLPAYLNAIDGKGVHVVTVNDYLARRDMEWMSPIYRGLGLTVGAIQSDMSVDDRQKAYDCDITYGTNNEFGFDYLRDNMRPAARGDERYPKPMQQSQGPLHFALIDEIDNILIDEARTPLIISGPAHEDVRKYAESDRIARKLQKGEHFEVNEKDHTVNLTETGVREAERMAGVESFYTAGNMEWPHLIDNALKAHYLYKRDDRYVVEDGQVIIVDEFTGRKMPGRQWSDGLHQAVEAKEGVKIKEETQTLATITLQNFFKLYKKIGGMTGTAMTEAGEFWKIYKLDVVAIPTNRPMQRQEFPDLIYCTEEEKYGALADTIERTVRWDVVGDNRKRTERWGTIVKYDEESGSVVFQDREGRGEKETLELAKDMYVERKGRPVLVGTTSIEKSELLSQLLERRGVKHAVLNAKFHKREAEIIAQAGRIGAVTIATNMAGRGTDIILGGNAETMAWARLQDKYATRLEVPQEEWDALVKEIETTENMKAEGEIVRKLGGLMVIGTERHEARRIDLQLRGRTGRQGDPGTSRFYLSLRDDLMRIFAGPWVEKILKSLGLPEGEAIESRMVTRRIEAAQKKVEERNFEVRKNLLEYDEVMDEQRKRVYRYRQSILEGVNCKTLIHDMIAEQAEYHVQMFLARDFGVETYAKWVGSRLSCQFEARDFRGLDADSAERIAKDRAERNAETQILDSVDENLPDGEEADEWNWGALAKMANVRWQVSVRDRELKQIGRDGVVEFLLEKAREAIDRIDLGEGAEFLHEDYGLNSMRHWMKNKFGIEVELEELRGLEPSGAVELVQRRAEAAYWEKETEYPVMAGIVRFSAKGAGGQSRLDRDSLAAWAKDRFSTDVNAESFKAMQRDEIHARLLEFSRRHQELAAIDIAALNAKLDEFFAEIDASADDNDTPLSRAASPEQLESLSRWLDREVDIQRSAAQLGKLTRVQMERKLHGLLEDRYHPEIRRMERILLLELVDGAWKDHLLAMDHLRSAVSFRGYAQVDPKVEYKREGMKLFDRMWESINQRATDLVFRMEQLDDDFVGSTWKETEARHDEAQSASDLARMQQEGIDASQADQKVEPIRNRGERVGRNDPCPCNSGKKYKNCCMGSSGTAGRARAS